MDRQITRLGTIKNASGVNTNLVIGDTSTCSIAYQSASHRDVTPEIDRRYGMTCRQCNKLLLPACEERIAADDERASTRLD